MRIKFGRILQLYKSKCENELLVDMEMLGQLNDWIVNYEKRVAEDGETVMEVSFEEPSKNEGVRG